MPYELEKPDFRGVPLSRRALFWLCFFGLFLVVFRTAVQTHFDTHGYGPDWVLPLIVYMGFHARIGSGAAVVAMLGFFMDAGSGSMFGLHGLVYLTLFFGAVLLRQKVDPSASYHQALLILVGALVSGLMIMAILSFFERPVPVLPILPEGPLVTYLASAVGTAFIGPLLFGCIGLFRKVFGGFAEENA